MTNETATPEEKMRELLTMAELLRERPIDLYPEQNVVTLQELKGRFDGKKIFACDFYIEDIETESQEAVGGFTKDVATNIDHHAPVEKMAQKITSTHLAIEYVKKFGTISDKENSAVVVNHTDCDSVLSSAILRGIIAPEDKFAQAAMSADHSGGIDEVADLLQAMQDMRDLEFSLRNLNLLLHNKPLEPKAVQLVEKRKQERAKAQELVESGAFQKNGDVYYIETAEKLDGVFFSSLMQDAVIYVVATPIKQKNGFYEIKVRLGSKAPDGLTLQKLGIQEFDPNHGSRWNAGSNKRGGGTDIKPAEYAEKINQKLQAYLQI